jgi:hypothetical protein
MGWNVPDDWGRYYSKCGYCGSQVHASEGGCGCLEDCEQCEGCKGGMNNRFFRGSENRAADEGWHHIDELTEIDGKYYCGGCSTCECCSLGEHGDEDEVAKLRFNEDMGGLLCPECWEDDHYCEAQGPLLDHMAKKVSEPSS